MGVNYNVLNAEVLRCVLLCLFGDLFFVVVCVCLLVCACVCFALRTYDLCLLFIVFALICYELRVLLAVCVYDTFYLCCCWWWMVEGCRL